jgi:5-methyltetrahydrofolate--homocysteine methyltransferase
VIRGVKFGPLERAAHLFFGLPKPLRGRGLKLCGFTGFRFCFAKKSFFMPEEYFNYMTANPLVYGMLKKFVADHRKNPTKAEVVLWNILRGKKLAGFKFRRQHIITCYIADFVCLRKKLIIEVDGLIHFLYGNELKDAARSIELALKGFRVIRFTNDEVLNDADAVVNAILRELTAASTNTSPSPSDCGPMEL